MTLSRRRDESLSNDPAGSEPLDQELEETRAALARRSRVLHEINHDLRTPLNSMLLQLHLAKLAIAGLDQESEQAQTLNETVASMKSSVQTITGLLNRLVEIDRSEPREPGAPTTAFGLSDRFGRCQVVPRGPSGYEIPGDADNPRS